MRRGTTDYLEFGIPYLASEIHVGYITFQQGGLTILEKSTNDADVELRDGCISIPFTQAMTLALPTGTIKMQIRLLLMNGDAPVSDEMSTYVNDVMKGGVIDG